MNSDLSLSRRKFIAVSAVGTASLASNIGGVAKTSTSTPVMSKHPLCTNQYPWDTFYRREGSSFFENLDKSIQAVAQSGAESLEPNIESIEMLEELAVALKKHGIQMRSLYVNSVLHEADQAKASIEFVLKIARRAQELCQTEIVVTNPSPISWGGPENKTDSQIVIQAKALNELGSALRKEGITLAYHNHDSELRLGARELHHSLVSTDPDNVKYCLDSHWVYRGTENSSVALFDVVELYADRILELHLRQSTHGIWNESFASQGDIDYIRLIAILKAKNIYPLIVSEQAIEEGSPHEKSALEAHSETHDNIRRDFAGFLGE